MTYAALVKLPDGRVATVGEWEHADAVLPEMSALVAAGLNVGVQAVVEHIAVDDLAALGVGGAG